MSNLAYFYFVGFYAVFLTAEANLETASPSFSAVVIASGGVPSATILFDGPSPLIARIISGSASSLSAGNWSVIWRARF